MRKKFRDGSFESETRGNSHDSKREIATKFVRKLSKVLQIKNVRKFSQMIVEHLFKQSKRNKITVSLRHFLKCKPRHKIPHNSGSFVCPAK